jgi:hypothetical protein
MHHFARLEAVQAALKEANHERMTSHGRTEEIGERCREALPRLGTKGLAGAKPD